MSKTTRKELFEEFKKTGEFSCPFCLRTDFECLEDLAQHIEIDHKYEIQETEEGLSKIAKENKEVLENWVTERKRELLLEIAEKNPRLLHEIQVSPHADEMLDKMVSEDLFKRALKVKTLSSFDAMWLKHPKFDEVYQAEKNRQKSQEEYTYEHKDGSTGQDEQTFEIPESPEAKKALDKKTPVNKVSFKDGKLVLTPEYEPERLPRNVIKYTGNREDLSDEDRQRLKTLLILQALMRKKSSN